MRKREYFDRKPVMNRHTNTTSVKDPTSACRACAIISLTLRHLAIKIVDTVFGISEQNGLT